MKTQKQDLTGANRGNRGGSQNLCSLMFKSGSGGVVQLDFDKSTSDGVNIYAKRGHDDAFTFLACRADPSRRSRTKAEVRRRRARDTAPAALACRAEVRRRRKSDEGWSAYIDNRPLLVAT